jgi:hypothetical protein
MTPPESTYHFTPRPMRQAMIERGLELDFPPAALPELAAIGGLAGATDDVRDLRDRLVVARG